MTNAQKLFNVNAYFDAYPQDVQDKLHKRGYMLVSRAPAEEFNVETSDGLSNTRIIAVTPDKACYDDKGLTPEGIDRIARSLDAAVREVTGIAFRATPPVGGAVAKAAAAAKIAPV